MTQEQFEKMRDIDDTIKRFERTIEKLDGAHMEMRLNGFAESYYGDSDLVKQAYYAYIPKEERDKLTAEMRERLKTAIQERINELKAEFEKI